MCMKSLFTHIHIKGMYSQDDAKLLVRRNKTLLFLGCCCFFFLFFFLVPPPPNASMDLHFSQLVILHVCCISIPPLLTDSLLVQE